MCPHDWHLNLSTSCHLRKTPFPSSLLMKSLIWCFLSYATKCSPDTGSWNMPSIIRPTVLINYPRSRTAATDQSPERTAPGGSACFLLRGRRSKAHHGCCERQALILQNAPVGAVVPLSLLSSRKIAGTPWASASPSAPSPSSQGCFKDLSKKDKQVVSVAFSP